MFMCVRNYPCSGEHNERGTTILVLGDLRIWGGEGETEVLQRECQAITRQCDKCSDGEEAEGPEYAEKKERTNLDLGGAVCVIGAGGASVGFQK